MPECISPLRKSHQIFLMLLSLMLMAFACTKNKSSDPVNSPPNEPHDPLPATGATNVSTFTGFDWQCEDPDSEALFYDFYLDTLSPPGLQHANLTSSNFSLENPLLYDKHYYWQVIARDFSSDTTAGPIWQFVTKQGLGLYPAGVCPTAGDARNVFVIRDQAYVAADFNGLEIFDITNPQDPFLMGNFIWPDIAAVDVLVEGNYAYLADANHGLMIIDVSNPFYPYMVGYASLPLPTATIALVGNYILAGCSNAGLYSVRVQDIYDPVVVDSLNLTGASVEDIAILSGYALLACGLRGLMITDISPPTTPTYVSTFNTTGYAYGVYATTENGSRHAYIADGSDGYRVIDFSDPENLQDAGSLATPGTVFDIYQDSNYVFMAASQTGLLVVDKSGETPFVAATYDTPGQCRKIFVLDHYIYIADGIEGVRIVEYVE